MLSEQPAKPHGFVLLIANSRILRRSKLQRSNLCSSFVDGLLLQLLLQILAEIADLRHSCFREFRRTDLLRSGNQAIEQPQYSLFGIGGRPAAAQSAQNLLYLRFFRWRNFGRALFIGTVILILPACCRIHRRCTVGKSFELLPPLPDGSQSHQLPSGSRMEVFCLKPLPHRPFYLLC